MLIELLRCLSVIFNPLFDPGLLLFEDTDLFLLQFDLDKVTHLLLLLDHVLTGHTFREKGSALLVGPALLARAAEKVLDIFIIIELHGVRHATRAKVVAACGEDQEVEVGCHHVAVSALDEVLLLYLLQLHVLDVEAVHFLLDKFRIMLQHLEQSHTIIDGVVLTMIPRPIVVRCR